MASTTLPGNLVDIIAAEMASGVDRAVECWMSQIEQALTNAHLTSFDRLQEVCQIVEKYKKLTGKTQLRGRAA